MTTTFLTNNPPASLQQQLRQAKWAFTTRRVRRLDAAQLKEVDLTGTVRPRHGDLVLAQVNDIGQHSGIQLKTGRRADLYPGDLIVVCIASRYAPDQFECVAELDGSYAHLVAAGGVAGVVTRQHGRMKTPTLLNILGTLHGKDGEAINVANYALPESAAAQGAGRKMPPVLAVFGASMNSGKSVMASSLVLGLTRAGYNVGACKATGTGAFGDVNAYRDAGARHILDFTDLGLASTFNIDMDIVRTLPGQLVAHLAHRQVDVVVMEIADGILQRETAALVHDEDFRALVNGTFFAAPDALSAINGSQHLEKAGHKMLAVSGLVTRSPMACEEAASHVAAPIVSRAFLSSAKGAGSLLEAAMNTSVSERFTVAA